MLYFLTKILKPSVVLETVRTPEGGRVLPFKPGESYRTEWVSESVLQTKSEEEDLQQPALQKSEEKKLKGRSTSSSKRERTLENSGGGKGGTTQSVSD
jgi:hypothetical protein